MATSASSTARACGPGIARWSWKIQWATTLSRTPSPPAAIGAPFTMAAFRSIILAFAHEAPLRP